MDFLNDIKAQIPDYAKDIKLNLDGTIARSSLSQSDAVGVALAASVAAKSPVLIEAFRNAGVLSPEEVQGVMTSASLMGMTNIWYTYTDMAGDEQLKTLQAQLRMNAYANHGGVDKRRFELYALAASIVGKCKFCVASHFDILKKEGMSVEQLRDVGRIAAVVNAASQVLVAG